MVLDGGSDDYPGMDLWEFTDADFVEIDSIIASISNQAGGLATPQTATTDDSTTLVPQNSLHSSGIDGNLSDAEPVLDVVDGEIPDASFRSDDFDLNLNALSADELAILDEESLRKTAQQPQPNPGPSITIELEEIENDVGNVREHGDNSIKKPSKYNSPLDEFRSYITLSVTDLVSPSWCEVQYEYGLRGKRHRPIHQRPKSFASSTGKIISPETTIMERNDIQTKQGLAVHKQLEKEIKFEELKVDITTDETRWALRIVNMLACLKGIMCGYTREMPVFGILHGEVVIGVMDEVVKEEVLKNHNGTRITTAKRPLSRTSSQSTAKRLRTESSSLQTYIDDLFKSPTKTSGRSTSPSQKSVGYILHIKDNKTRKNHYLPTEPDMYSGRLQLMIYRRLLSELLETNPPYDFTTIWRKVDVDPSAIFPTKFLVQAQLIQESDGFQSSCLNDLVNMWHEEVKSLNILGVDTNLELVYRLRPSPGQMGEGKEKARLTPLPPIMNEEDQDLAKAIAASLEETSTLPGKSSVVERDQPDFQKINTTDQDQDAVGSLSTKHDSEDIELQWALHESSTGRPQPSAKEDVPSENKPENVIDKGKGKEKEQIEQAPTEEGIRRFKIIGTKKFLHDDEELDRYLDHVLAWWRGERKPEGVPLERVYRCSTCEYANDCEWRDQKALEMSKKKSLTS